MLAVKGEVILNGSATAPVSIGIPRAGSVFACTKLTVAEVRRALDAGVVGIVSETGNFACHAANLIRNARRQGADIFWIRGVSVVHADEVQIGIDGTCQFNDGASAFSNISAAANNDQYGFRPAAMSWCEVSLWPRRRYGQSEFELVRPGLEACATELAGELVAARLYRNRIWFSKPAPTSKDLLAYALHYQSSIAYLMRMLAEYSTIVTSLRSGQHDNNIPLLFFGTLLPFHETYSEVAQSIAIQAGSSQGAMLDSALTNGVVRWLDQAKEFRTSAKVPGDREWDGFMPPGLPEDYADETCRDLIAAYPDLDPKLAHWISVLCVVKEFKMIISKNIYARFLEVMNEER